MLIYRLDSARRMTRVAVDDWYVAFLDLLLGNDYYLSDNPISMVMCEVCYVMLIALAGVIQVCSWHNDIPTLYEYAGLVEALQGDAETYSFATVCGFDSFMALFDGNDASLVI